MGPMPLLLILLLHLAVAVLLPSLVRAHGSRAFYAASLPPAAAAVWVLSHAPGILAGSPVEASFAWVPALGIEIAFRIDALALTMTLLVSGVGAVIFCYSASYFRSGAVALGRLCAVLLLFAGAMLGVVTTDNLFVLFVFWELTSVTSFLLIGNEDRNVGARRAAVQALIVTSGSGLLMLVGFVLLGEIGGTYRISELVSAPPTGDPWLPVAVVLVLAGAFAKSAQVPLHFWLPGAMVAPTPVSAYLHAAAMVKGGVYLVARLAPGFADVEPWRVLVITIGLATMLLGGWRALRQSDLKLLLAHGTVSQLGFLTLLAGTGSRLAAIAAVGALLAHGFFKGALFLTVGVIDKQTGTRTIGELAGLGRRMPLLAAGAAAAAASMAGVPPMLGFVGKEAALEAFVPGHTPQLPGWASVAVLLGIAGASVLTFGYSARFLWGAFAGEARDGDRAPEAPSRGFVLPPLLLAAAGIVCGVSPALLADPLAQGYASGFREGSYHLALWHGATPALGISALIIAGGAVLFWKRRAVARAQRAMAVSANAEVSYHMFTHAVYTFALGVTRRAQSGSLPVYLGIILATLLALPGVRLVVALVNGDVDLPEPGQGLRLWDSPLEGLVAVVIAVTAVATVREHRRFPALILLSATGFALTGLFVLHGAPDLALTLLLVETLTTIILVFVLRRLPATFSTRPNGWMKRLTVLLCAAVGTLIAALLWLMTAARTDPPVSRGLAEQAKEAGGHNLVNMILAEFRALDTFGEVIVLATAAVAVSSLVLLNRRNRVVEEEPDETEEEHA
ncbi:multicomponent Na+:H+ antiporter subunit A [Haloactinospora alba]|uniref:Multicomponent Na+:H+ antiporter subunit A n=2 Tax=Haloactinospora alba TaxID=405555 RepID=A0A543NKH0_9ACTN|nr:multicomponent Na+:H+ antiporter subunit A [Haloactinospora alba]